MALSAQKKGPAAASTAPDHGSTTPAKEMAMNKHFSSTETATAATAFATLDDIELAVTQLRDLLEVNKGLLLDMPFERDGTRDVALDQINSLSCIACDTANRIEQMISHNFSSITGGRS